MVEMVSKHYILVVDFHDVYEARRWSVVTELLHEFWVTVIRSLAGVKNADDLCQGSSEEIKKKTMTSFVSRHG